MFEPKYLVRLDKKSFPNDQVVCLGSQLICIINTISKSIGSHNWLCADIDAISPIPQKLGVDSFQLMTIGDDFSLINICKNIDQFLSGVFIALSNKSQNLKYSDLCVGTEDDQFRSLELNGVLIEIRTFDTSYFEIYSENQELINNIAKIYNAEVENANS